MGLSEQYPAYGGYGSAYLATGIILTIIGTILTTLRVYVRMRISKHGTAALAWALVAWSIKVLSMVTEVLRTLTVLNGLGNHLVAVEAAGLSVMHRMLKFSWLSVFFFIIAVAVIKMAVAAFILEVNGSAHPRIRCALIAVVAINFSVAIPVAIYSQFSCHPVDAIWDPLR